MKTQLYQWANNTEMYIRNASLSVWNCVLFILFVK